MEDLEDFLEFVDIVEEQELVEHRLPKRYIRDIRNPMEFYAPAEFKKRYIFNKEIVRDRILPMASIEEKINNRGLPIPSIIAVLITLRFYATGCFQRLHGDLRGYSQATVSRIIKTISIGLAENVQEFIKFPPTEELQRKNIVSFYEMYNFPSVSGCIDCTHISIKNPGTDIAEVFRNRKQYFSLNVQVVSGPRMEILDIVVRHPGSTQDNTIFQRSRLHHRLQNGEIIGLLLGDNSYTCEPYLLTPFLHANGKAEENYNRAHVSTRKIIERLFGVWKQRFPCLKTTLRTHIHTSVAVICATAVLHNLAVELHEDIPNDVPPHNELQDNFNVQDQQKGLDFRKNFVQTHF